MDSKTIYVTPAIYESTLYKSSDVEEARLNANVARYTYTIPSLKINRFA
jgi:hypothetical protein